MRSIHFYPLVGVALILGACGAQGADPSPTAADEEILKGASVATDEAGLLKFFQERTLPDDSRKTITELIAQLGDDDYGVREKATDALRAKGAMAASLLRQTVGNRDADIEAVRRAEKLLENFNLPDSHVIVAAVRLLAARKSADTASSLLAFLPFSETDSVTEEIRSSLALVAVRDGRPEPALLKGLKDPSPLKRGASGAALAAVVSEREAVHKLLEDEDRQVRLWTALSLATAKDKTAIPVLIALLGDLPPDPAWRAEDLLCRLAGEQTPRVSLGNDPAGRTRCRDAWAEWWKKNGDGVDLAKLTQTPPRLGYTLVAQMNMNNGQGSVCELDAARKKRWNIDGLAYPIDAQVIGNDRVLITEFNGGQVTERDTAKGEILWQFPIQQPINAQRLPDGTTFVAARNVLVIVDREKKEKFRYNRPNFDMMAAVRLRDGGFFFVTNQGVGVRLDPTGKEVKNFNVGRPNVFGGLDALPDGRVLVPQFQTGKVVEFDLDGKETWSAPYVQPSGAQRLSNGNTLLASFHQRKVVEADNTGKALWEYQTDGWLLRVRGR